MKRLFAVGVAVMLAAAACGGNSDTPRAFATPKTLDVALLNEARAIAQDLRSLLTAPTIQRAVEQIDELGTIVQAMDLPKNVERRLLFMVGALRSDLADILGDDVLRNWDDLSQSIVDTLETVDDPATLNNAIQATNNIVSDLTKFDPDVYSKLSPTINRIKQVLERSGTDDQLEQVRTWAEQISSNLDDVGGNLERATQIAGDLQTKLQAVLDRILP